ncbi:MAG TPA: ATP-binding protein [Caulobacteraceae bacterium]|jgi:signal transduction histidine kinase/CheY-like chemotaxis protein|nr:ATP-binding protein [Caulobacteraceae bacterium]
MTPPKIPLRWRLVPAIALASAVVLLMTGLAIGAYSERVYQGQKQQEAGVQAQILAASVTAALAFNDRNAASEYIAALRANPEVETAGVYDENGVLVASYARPGLTAPAHVRPTPPHVEQGRLVVTAPVVQDDQELGLVSVQMATEPFARRWVRYGGTGLLVIMALVMVGVLSVAHGLMTRASRELATRADELADANRQLLVQIAERERAEEALRQSQRLEALGRLTGGVAHDFNNILMVASSGLDLIDRTTDPVRREAIRAGVRQAVERGAGLTRQLLTFARRGALKPEVIDLAARIEGMGVLLERSLRENIQVALSLPPDLWAVEADPSELELALLNLAVNARDAMPSGGQVRIEAENLAGFKQGELLGDYVRLSVSDTGGGIAPDQIGHVFEPFFTTKEVGKGTGLGLSQVYGFTRSSGGDARIDSVVGRGTKVSLYLPRSRKPLTRAEEPKTLESVPDGQGRILLVEDDPAVAAMVCEMLKDLGYEVSHASAAAAALDVLDHEPAFDLVFSDMVMPGGMDGIELAREVGRRRPELPILLTTGFSPAAAAAQREGRRLLPKPYTIENLAAALKALLGAKV